VRLGLNMLHLVPGETGGSELYARRLVPALLAARPELDVVVFAAREGVASLRAESWGADVVEVEVNARSRPRRVLAEQTLLPRAVRHARLDLLHNLFTTAPALPGTAQVATIQDLIYKRFPEAHRGMLARGMALLVPLAVHRSRRLLTYSEASKRDIVEFLGVAPDRIDVTLLGPGLEPGGTAPLSEADLRTQLGLPDGSPLLLSVSAKRAHKNLARLIDAVAMLPDDVAPILVVPGYETELEDELKAHARASGAEERVRFLGWVPEATLEGLYRAARCFVFPSLAEGFGLPVLEAMLRGTPVACSDATSIPEVAGDAALYFDPTDTAAMAAAIETLLRDEDLRRTLAAAGREQAAQFTWERCARLTLESYDRALAA
jgi:glycosyltransferase involved in cell wall biosynthesis